MVTMDLIDDDDAYSTFQTSALIFSNYLQFYRACSSVMHLVTIMMSELDEDSIGDFSVNYLLPKVMRLQRLLGGHISLFRINTGFYPHEFEQLCESVCPVIASRSRSTNMERMAAGRRPKLTTAERLLSCILYLRDNNSVREESSHWNYSRTSLNDDAPFICSIINEVMATEVSWPNAERRQVLRQRIPQLPGCIGFVDGTLCKIRRPACPEHRAYFNGRKKLYCFNSTVIIDHDGLFIFVAAGFAGSYHDVNVLCRTAVVQDWQQYFSIDEHSPYPLEYLLGDPGYLGMDHFVLRRIDTREIPNVDDDPVLRAFNRLHSGFRVAVEWGIGGLKQKFRKFLHTCPNRRNKFEYMFTTAAILTNFIHRRRKDFDIAILSQHSPGEGEWHA